MKSPIEWHEKNLVNVEILLEWEQKRLIEATATVNRLTKNVEFRRLQISEAMRQKKDSFDADKFLVKRKNEIRK